MAREPRLAEVFDRTEDGAVASQDLGAQPSGRLDDENLSQQYYGSLDQSAHLTSSQCGHHSIPESFTSLFSLFRNADMLCKLIIPDS